MPEPSLPVRSKRTPPKTLTDLPPELLDHIVSQLPSSQSISRLSQTSKRLLTFIEQDAWQTFGRNRFPSLWHNEGPLPHRDAVRTLATLSRAWDRRAFLARSVEPHGDIRAFPGGKKIERWRKPKGQSIGFAPQIDCLEEVGSSWRNRREVLAFSAGAELCIREKKTTGRASGAKSRWWTYRPASAFEGRDDITSLHLLRPQQGETGQYTITGTANGDLQLLRMPSDTSECLPHTYFVTQGLPVRSSSVHQAEDRETLLAANMGDTRVSLYRVTPDQKKVTPLSSIDIRRPENAERSFRAWSTHFLSANTLAVGLGPSDEPIHIYHVLESGIESEPIRTLQLQLQDDRIEIGALSESIRVPKSSVYPIIPLPARTHGGGSADGQIFLTGAYDGVVRLHDLRSPSTISRTYSDPIDDSAIYSLLARGQESLVAGTSRHSLLKVFDLRLGSKAYSYLDAAADSQTTALTSSPLTSAQQQQQQNSDWSLFVKPSNATYSGRGGGNNWARRSAESSIYSLASPSPMSPFLYAGVENAVIELAFTGVLDRHPDPAFFPLYREKRGSRGSPWKSEGTDRAEGDGSPYDSVFSLAMHDHTADFRLCTQRGVFQTWDDMDRMRKQMEFDDAALATHPLSPCLDERWRVPDRSKS